MKYRLAQAVCLLALVSPAVRAQQSETATVSTTTELVLVPAQVKGHDGKPLLGLKAEDFVLRSDGKPLPIRVFEETQQNASQPQRITTAPPATANTVFNLPDGGMPDRILIIALDLVNTATIDQGRARQDLLKYLSSQPTHQHFALVAITGKGLAQIHNFSSDPAVLIEALQKMQSSTVKDASDAESLASVINAETFATSATSTDVYQTMLTAYNQAQVYGAFAQKEAARATLTAMMQIAQAYAGVPGRKSVIWITAGMPTLIYDAFAGGVKGVSGQVSLNGSSGGGGGVLNGDPELLDAYNRAFAALNNANIAVYGIDVKGVHHNRDYEGTGINQQIASKATNATIYGPTKMIQPGDYQDDAIKVVSSATGGKSCTANKGLDDCIDAAVADSSSYYMLGFYVPQQDRKAGWHKLEVKLASERGSVRSRNSYYLASTIAPTEKEVNRTLWDAVNARIAYTGVGFAVQREAPDPAKPGAAGMRIFVPSRSILMTPGHPQLSYDIVSVPLDNKGDPAANMRVVHLNLTDEQTQSALNKGWSYVDQPDGGGKQPVKYVLRDNGTGRIGSVIVLPQKVGG